MSSVRKMAVAVALLSSSAGWAQPDEIHPAWQDFAPRFELEVCPFAGGSAEYDIDRVTCGYVLVPEHRGDPNSRLIKLSAMTVDAREDPSPELTVVLVTGGPGDPAVGAGLARYLTRRRARIATHGDYVAFDQRGIGYSEPALCRAVTQPWQRGVSTAAGETLFIEDMRRCLDEARKRGIVLDAYSFWHNVLDFRDVRRALGYEQWNLQAFSNGTRIAQTLMQVDAEGVRAAVFDSPIPNVVPDDSRVSSPAFGFRSALNAIDEACTRDSRCSEDVGSVAARIEAILAAYGAEPLIVENADPRVFKVGRVVLDGTLLASALFRLLYSASNHAALPVLLNVLEERDAEALAIYASRTGVPPADHIGGRGMGLISLCRGGFAAAPEELLASEPVFGRWLNSGFTDEAFCRKVYKVDPDPSVFRLESAIPTLVLSGSADPVSPPRFGEMIMPGLVNATHLTFPHVAHGVVRTLDARSPDCGSMIMETFLSNPGGPIDASCAETIDAPRFITRIRSSQRPFGFVADVYRGAWPIMPGLVLVGLLFAVAAFPIAALGRRVGGRVGTERMLARLLAWLGALLSAAGAALAAAAIWTTANDYPLVLPVGLVPWISWAGWLGLAGSVAALLAAVQCFRRRSALEAHVGTTAGVFATTTLSIAWFAFLISIGAGPL